MSSEARGLLWFCAAAVLCILLMVALLGQPQQKIYAEVGSWSPTAIDEMCEVWGQDRWAVIEALLVLDSSIAVADAQGVAVHFCGGGRP